MSGSSTQLKKGLLIVIEGIDGAGKSSQMTRLVEHFSKTGYEVKRFREPTDGPYGKQIRDHALNARHQNTPEEELALFVRDREENCRVNLRPALDRKELVFLDRYYFSTIAYQGALGLDTEMIRKKNEAIAIRPDLVIIMDVPVQVGRERISRFRNEAHNDFENEEYLEKVRELFLRMKDPFIRVVDCSEDEETVFRKLKEVVSDLVEGWTE